MLDDLFLFANRTEAGKELAAKLLEEPIIKEASAESLLVLSIPCGGVVIGAAIAGILGCAHSVIAVKKIGFPGHQELAIGAIAEDGTIVLNPRVKGQFNSYVDQALERVKVKLEATIQKFRQGRELDLKSKTVIVVDDGIATGETMKAAVIWLRSRADPHRPRKVLVAVPVCSPHATEEFQMLTDRLVCLVTPQRFWAVGQFYWNFDQISDEEAIAYLRQTAPAPSAGQATLSAERVKPIEE